MSEYIVSENFIDKTELVKGEYEDCIFKNCDFSEYNLSLFIFTDCEFVNCNLSNAALSDTAFRDVKFVNCKLLGVQFSDCNNFSLAFSFTDCILDYSSFYQLKIKKTVFTKCRLIQTDFVETDLSGAVFQECDLSGAVFERSNLEHAKMSTAYNFAIDPESNNINKTVFSKHNVMGLLCKYNIKIED
ncbi:pentapeptide repeat-containing protein [Plebeiibacterium sediminum]|uniref:Pentapeptide repeat-containing protein n=1 Tax=Plebeiibacterium sediminum TaxID=2992112 RepID=A0AAE3M7E7_9BACT|nr:pentapeptide repeat-containing protein [Plebeiobacterium sediminum]MCW3788639.1 pentapeptide repeat-containing protein [Plebeiobacterium sediminum]